MGVPLSKLEATEDRILQSSQSERTTQKSRSQMQTLSVRASGLTSSRSSSSKSSSSSTGSNSATMSAPGKATPKSETSVNAVPSRLLPTSNDRLRSQSNVTPAAKSCYINNRPSTPPPLPERPRYLAQSALAEAVGGRDSGISLYSPSSADARPFLKQSPHFRKKALKIDEEELLKRVVFDHNDEHEYNRQLRQHYVFKQVFGNTSVTFDEPPATILDSASGAGFWSLDMAQEYPDAKVISLDMSFTEGEPPRSNITCRTGNIMSPPLSFASNTFDFVYQRDVGTVLPLLYWQPLITDFYRILKPNGLVQLVEYDLVIPSFGPYTQEANKVMGEVMRTTGYDPHFTNSLGTMLHLAGFTNVERHVVQIPVGEWPEDEVGRQQGFLNRELVKGLFRSLGPRLVERLGIKSNQYEESYAAMIREIEDNKGSSEVKIFTARKP